MGRGASWQRRVGRAYGGSCRRDQQSCQSPGGWVSAAYNRRPLEG